MSANVVEAELVSEALRAGPAEASAPLHIEIHAWPKLLKARCAIIERGRRREVALDGSLLVALLSCLGRLR